MSKLNACVTGDTKIITVEGVKTFKELSERNSDVLVYCLDKKGKVVVSKMFNPRVTGYKMETMKVTLEDGSEFVTTLNHRFLTKNGYMTVDDLDLTGGELLLCFDEPESKDVNESIIGYTEFTGTKKGTIIKKCEITGEEFECDWEERELCSAPDNDKKVSEMMDDLVSSIESGVSRCHRSSRILRTDYIQEKQTVYNGTVAVYHNYFTIDETTGTAVNQLNCGE